jgi:hypothetical protein
MQTLYAQKWPPAAEAGVYRLLAASSLVFPALLGEHSPLWPCGWSPEVLAGSVPVLTAAPFSLFEA